MANGFSIQIEGSQNVQNSLSVVRSEIQKKILRGGVSFAIAPLKPAEQQAAPTKMGVLRRSIGVRVKAYKEVVFAAIGPLAKYKETVSGTFPFHGPRNLKPRIQKPSKYAHLVEGGVKPHFIPAPGWGKDAKKTVQHFTAKSTPGWKHPGSKSQPFINTVSVAMSGKVKERFSSYVIKRIETEYRKSIQKGVEFFAGGNTGFGQ